MTMALHRAFYCLNLPVSTCVPASVAQLDACPTGDQEVAGSTPTGQKHSFVEIDHEIFLVILSHWFMKGRTLLVSGERMCTILVKRLED